MVIYRRHIWRKEPYDDQRLLYIGHFDHSLHNVEPGRLDQFAPAVYCVCLLPEKFILLLFKIGYFSAAYISV